MTTISNDVLLEKINNVQSDVKDIKVKLESKYVTQDQFEPIKKIVYGLVGLVLIAFAGGLINLVIQK